MPIGAVWRCLVGVARRRVRIPFATNIWYAQILSKLVLHTFLPRQNKFC